MNHQTPPLNRLDFAFMLLLFAGSILLRVYLLAPTGFDGLYGQDSYAYYDFARELRAAFNEGSAPGAFFWPLGYPALLAVIQTFFGAAPTTGQIVSLVMGAALPPLVYLLARKIGSEQPGALVAGLVIAACGQALQSSLVLMADVPALFWTMVSAVALWTYLDDSGGTGRTLLLPLSALTLVLAAVTRWLYLILIIPWALTLLIAWRGRVRWRVSIISLLAATVILIPQMIYSWASPNPVLSHAWVEGWSPANALRQVFENIDGRFEYEKINALYYAQPFYDIYYLAPFFTPFLFIGIWRLFHDQRHAALVMVIGWGLLPYLFLVGIPYQNIRFPLIIFPAAALLAGHGLESAAGWAGRIIRQPYVNVALFICLAFSIGQTLLNARNTTDSFINRQQEDKNAALWAAAQIPTGSSIYTFGLTLTLKHYTSLNVYELYYETPQSLEQKWKPGLGDYLLVNVWNIEHQWAGRDPQLDFHWLRDRRGLIRLGKNGYYTLYQVRG